MLNFFIVCGHSKLDNMGGFFIDVGSEVLTAYPNFGKWVQAIKPTYPYQVVEEKGKLKNKAWNRQWNGTN